MYAFRAYSIFQFCQVAFIDRISPPVHSSLLKKEVSLIYDKNGQKLTYYFHFLQKNLLDGHSARVSIVSGNDKRPPEGGTQNMARDPGFWRFMNDASVGHCKNAGCAIFAIVKVSQCETR